MNFDSYSQRRSIGGPKIELHQGPQQNYSKEDIEALIPEVIGKNDEELRRLKKSLIDSYYYKESSLIQQYIDLSKTDNTWKVVESFQEWLNQEIINALSNFEKNQEEITKESKEFEIRLRKEIESSLKQMMQRHIEELTNVEIMKSLEISREKNRVSQEVNDLWKQSKKLATKDDFEGAMKTKDLGDKMHAQQGERRREMVIEKYDKINIENKSEVETKQIRSMATNNINAFSESLGKSENMLILKSEVVNNKISQTAKHWYSYIPRIISYFVDEFIKIASSSLPVNCEAGLNFLTLKSFAQIMKRVTRFYKTGVAFIPTPEEKGFMNSLPPSFHYHFHSLAEANEYHFLFF